MASSDIRRLLVSLQLSDSAFPSGFYTLSHGLEGFSQAKLIVRGGVEELLADILTHSVGPGDATALAAAHRAARVGAWDVVREVDQRLFASKLNAEMRKASVRSGHQFTEVARSAYGGAELEEFSRMITERTTPGCQAVATAVAYAGAGVDTEQAIASDLFAFSVSFVGAALRLRLTDHVHAQGVLNAVAPVIERAAAAAITRDIHDMGGCVPLADIMSARHERAEARLFAS